MRNKTCPDCGDPITKHAKKCKACAAKKSWRHKAITIGANRVKEIFEELKQKIVFARRAGNDKEAALLSEEKERVKKTVLRRCIDCDEPVARAAIRCRIHHNIYRNYGRALKQPSVVAVA
jgi:hypothetical protein